MSAAPHLKLVEHLIDENGEIQGCPHCQESREECEIWERRVITLERQVKRLQEDRDAKLRSDKFYPLAAALFEEWQRECSHPDAEFDTNRISLALRAVKRYGKKREALSMVIQYGKHLAFVDEKGHRHDSFGLLFRDAEHIESYANKFARWAKRQGAVS
jgi:uncharacterized protein with PIN domain